MRQKDIKILLRDLVFIGYAKVQQSLKGCKNQGQYFYACFILHDTISFMFVTIIRSLDWKYKKAISLSCILLLVLGNWELCLVLVIVYHNANANNPFNICLINSLYVDQI